VSRIGRKPIPITAGVKVQKSGQNVTVTGPKGELAASVDREIAVEIKVYLITVARSTDIKAHRALHGLWRALLANMVRGVTEGYTRKLELVGVGYRAELKGKKLQLMLGFSHPILFQPPEGIKIETPKRLEKGE
jgi:large subunit ribosomal protein L6